LTGGAEEGIATSLFAYGKYLFICMGLLALWYEPLSKKWAGLILITQIIQMLFDGGRTPFFGLVVAYALILSRNGVIPKISHVGYAFLFGFTTCNVFLQPVQISCLSQLP
jgi:hypothetical protein